MSILSQLRDFPDRLEHIPNHMSWFSDKECDKNKGLEPLSECLSDINRALILHLARPTQESTPYLFNSPHSGRIYPQFFKQMSCLDDFSLRLSEDRFVDLMFSPLVDEGATFMAAHFPRAYLDVNREAFELDATMFTEPLPAFVPPPSLRVKAGFGSIARIVSAGKAIYDHKLPVKEALDRIRYLYKPYHNCLNRELQNLRTIHGLAILIDCHSMPGKGGTHPSQISPDIILGDAHGRACAPVLMDRAEKLLCDLGYRVVRNHPYAGGYITCHYGKPFENIHALQIEINRDLYLDPQSLEKNDGFKPLCDNMLEFGRCLIQSDIQDFLSFRNAAE